MAKILIDSNLTHLKSYLKVINKVQKLMVSGNMSEPSSNRISFGEELSTHKLNLEEELNAMDSTMDKSLALMALATFWILLFLYLQVYKNSLRINYFSININVV